MSVGDVRAFYEELPFNVHGSAEAMAAVVRPESVEHVFPDLHELVGSGRVRTAIEFGCGAGWLAHTLALHYGLEVTAVDFCASALARAREVSARLGISGVRFVESDLFAFDTPERFDLVVSMGVLHHTPDAARAFLHIARFVDAGGRVQIGLYHIYGRRPFLRTLRGVVAEQGEDAAFELYKKLDRRTTDETYLRSWFRDQVLHPHETQHSLREVMDWLDGSGFVLESTSINRFEPVTDLEAILASETDYEAVAEKALEKEQRFFPGFFSVLARRSDAR